MRVTLITNMELPGGFVLHADTPAEELFLRQFGNVKDKDVIASCGGNISEGRAWLTVTHLTKRAVDEGDSSAVEGDTSPEVLSAGEAGSTPALHH